MRASDDISERRALTLLGTYLDLPVGDARRDALLKGEPASVRERVLALQSNASLAAAALPTTPPDDIGDGDDDVPARIGAFALVRRIATGGMGDVWLGERDDGLFDQRVAVKLVRRGAMRRTIDAFNAERRFMARLEHPRIARLLDGGVTEDGRSWLTSEFVDGRPLGGAAAERSLADRVRLMIEIAETIRFAHLRGIAHGDIKPDNILVDDEGLIKVIDFGVAGLLGDKVTGSGALTQGFASPEREAGAPPSVAADVFALGRTLIVLMGEDTDGELQAIAATATADAARRYTDVAALVVDLRRWHDGRPVRAFDGGLAYRTRKFVVRHRVAVPATLLTSLVLVVSLLVAQQAERQARRERAAATARFEDMRRAAHYMSFDLTDRLQRQPGTLRLRAQVLRVAQGYLERLSTLPGAPPAVRLDAIDGYVRVATTLGIGNSPNLGDIAEAERYLRRADAMLRQTGKDPITAAALAASTARVAALTCQTRIYGSHDAAAALRATIDGERRVEELVPSAQARYLLWPLRVCQGDALVWLDRSAEAIPLLRGELAAARQREAADLTAIARNLRFLGEAYFYAHRYDEAAASLSEALDLLGREHDRAAFLASTVNEYAGVADDLASTYSQQGRYAEGLRVARRAMELTRAQAALDRDDVQSERRSLSLARLVADALAHVGRRDEAIALMGSVGRRWDALVDRFPDDGALARLRIMSQQVSGDLERHAGRPREACELYRRAAEGWSEFEHRWRLSPSDATESVSIARRNVLACSGRGSFSDV